MKNQPPNRVENQWGSSDMAQSKENTVMTTAKVNTRAGAMVAEARSAAGGKDVYIDGGALIRQACDAGLIDEMTVTLAPVALGAGHALFAGLQRRLPLEIAEVHRHLAGMIQLRLVPIGSAAEGS